MVKNTQIIFSKVPTGLPKVGEHITVQHSDLDINSLKLNQGDILIKTLVLSVDPYMRGRMRDASMKSYSPAFELGKPMNGHGVAVVVKTANDNFKEGDYVYGMIPFAEYTHLPEQWTKVLQVRNEARDDHLPLPHYVGVLGMPGMTAYVGLYKFGQPKEGETIWISAASGAVGQLVGQLAKAEGLRVIGSVGDDKKSEYLLKECGFDGVFNYKTQDMDEQLTRLAPNGIDIYFENVGGKHLEVALAHANNHARFPTCGMISQYNLSHQEPVHNLMNIVIKRIQMCGFIVGDHAQEMGSEFVKRVTQMIKDGKVTYKDDVTNGIEGLPDALIGLFEGKNFGKAVVQVADQ
ncbi:hypothetical protein BZG36_03310 [Bifiguratus adelaidae]|uniref:Enoyl reductase (ER) domain-containing protein n=1 Tax=Bifiguratus adelaidae TaxID=1938954 RepID=A0A261XZB8_9FUNG|nr:hypothetical protein BZG36_03310 [Bifiguratus adelaidae]